MMFNNIDKRMFTEKNKNGNYKITKGVYANIEESNVKKAGIIADEMGPLIFFDELIFKLKDSNFNFNHKSLENLKAEFSFSVNDKEVIKLIYKKPYSNYDAWSDEKEIDFFQWILDFSVDESSKNKFISLYTI